MNPQNKAQPAHPTHTTGAQREKLHALRYDLVPFQEMTEAFARAAEHGVKKHAAWNWSLGLPRVQIAGSLLRHTFAYLRGEERDKDSGLLHTDHMVWNAVTLAHHAHWNICDDRRAEPVREYHLREDRELEAALTEAMQQRLDNDLSDISLEEKLTASLGV